jgi:hypothetical protein
MEVLLPEEFLSPKQLAQRWGVSTQYLAGVRSAGQGCVYYKLGHHVRYKKSDVFEFERAGMRTIPRKGD